MSNKLYIYDCLNGKLRVSNAAIMSIGRAQGNVFRCNMGVDTGGSFAQRGDHCLFFPHASIESYSLNGSRYIREATIKSHEFNLFVLAGGCFICWVGEDSQLPDFSVFNHREWFVYDKVTTRWQGPMPLQALIDLRGKISPDSLVVFSGLNSCAFVLADMYEVADFATRGSGSLVPNSQAQQPPSSATEQPNIPEETFCPNCWQPFRLAELKAVAVHPKLCGDEILGEKEQKRFIPSKVDAQGVAIDEMGITVREYACPRCHHKLVPFFSRTKRHIFSLIGMPSAGKTYYLASMLHELEQTLPREFGIAFRDADPSANAPLNAMRIKLFTASCPQDAYLGKTSPQGHLYHKVWKDGQMLTLPRPFIYNLSKENKSHSLVFYDTAGENCEPGDHSQSAGHLAAASAILFLFDPTSDAAFRKLINEGNDPQLRGKTRMQERQGLILSETEMRLRTALRLPPDKQLDIPLAVIIGKSDAWEKLLGAEPLLPSVRNGRFQPKFIDANSKRLRQLLFNVSPHICANAESISTNVRYFAASSFGAPPETYTDEATGDTLLAPAGGKVYPSRVIDPMLWALHCLEKDLLSKPRF